MKPCFSFGGVVFGVFRQVALRAASAIALITAGRSTVLRRCNSSRSCSAPRLVNGMVLINGSIAKNGFKKNHRD
jgi:hypothetical protein